MNRPNDQVEVNAILQEDQGEIVSVARGGKTLRVLVTPLTMADLLDAEVTDALAVIVGKLMEMQDLTPRRDDATQAGAGEEEKGQSDITEILGVIRQVLPAARVCLSRCVDVPLARIPHPAVPAVLEAFIRQNFMPAQLAPWADLLSSLKGRLHPQSLKGAAETISATASNSSSNTGTATGGATPATSSSSGSGVASARSAAPAPM